MSEHFNHKHGESSSMGTRPATAEYVTWQHMWDRCTNVRSAHYADYGGRGIIVCERWACYEYFLADMGRKPTPAHTIERKDVNVGYIPENCRWATRREQNRNRRDRPLVTIRGESRLLVDWADVCGTSVKILYQRIHRDGWTPEQAVFGRGVQ